MPSLCEVSAALLRIRMRSPPCRPISSIRPSRTTPSQPPSKPLAQILIPFESTPYRSNKRSQPARSTLAEDAPKGPANRPTETLKL